MSLMPIALIAIAFLALLGLILGIAGAVAEWLTNRNA